MNSSHAHKRDCGTFKWVQQKIHDEQSQRKNILNTVTKVNGASNNFITDVLNLRQLKNYHNTVQKCNLEKTHISSLHPKNMKKFLEF